MQQLLAEKQILLKFDGIDTFATVTLNGQDILEANNFHRWGLITEPQGHIWHCQLAVPTNRQQGVTA